MMLRRQRYALQTALIARLATAATSALPYPRAAVAVTVMRTPPGGVREYLLARRSKPPRAGSWSLPGGKIELGETTLWAAARELQEETALGPNAVSFHPWPIGATDVIVANTEDTEVQSLAFHYVITQMFAFADSEAAAVCGDDAAAVRWATRAEICSGNIDLGGNVAAVVGRAEALLDCGALMPSEAVRVTAGDDEVAEDTGGLVER